MRIMQIMLAKGFGGAERSFVDISNALASRGHEVVALCEKRGMAAQHLETINVELLRVSGAWDPFVKRKLARLIARHRPDIIQAHLARAAYFSGTIAAQYRIPSLVKTHNYVDLKYYQAMDHLVATTQDQFDYLIGEGWPETRCSIIPNFTRIPPSAPRTFDAASDDTVRLVAIGRFVGKKGFEDLITAFANLVAEFKVRLDIAGDGEDRGRLIDLISQLDLSDKVSLVGWQDDVAAFLRTGNLFILPSHDEPFGITSLEAVACGLPVIATRTKGPLEVFDPSSATLVPTRDPAALSNAIRELLLNPDKARTQVENASRLLADKYTEQIVVDQYEALYQALAEH